MLTNIYRAITRIRMEGYEPVAVWCINSREAYDTLLIEAGKIDRRLIMGDGDYPPEPRTIYGVPYKSDKDNPPRFLIGVFVESSVGQYVAVHP